MYTRVMLLILAISLCLLTGCSSVPSANQVTNSHVETGIDHERMNRVERINQSRGVNTIWVNAPQQKVDREKGS